MPVYRRTPRVWKNGIRGVSLMGITVRASPKGPDRLDILESFRVGRLSSGVPGVLPSQHEAHPRSSQAGDQIMQSIQKPIRAPGRLVHRWMEVLVRRDHPDLSARIVGGTTLESAIVLQVPVLGAAVKAIL